MTQALDWFRKAAEQGHHEAQVELRILLRSEEKQPSGPDGTTR